MVSDLTSAFFEKKVAIAMMNLKRQATIFTAAALISPQSFADLQAPAEGPRQDTTPARDVEPARDNTQFVSRNARRELFDRPAWQRGPTDGPAELPVGRALSISEGISTLLDKSDILIIGENHMAVEKIFPEIVRVAAKKGVDTLYIEWGEDLQPFLDRFYETGSVKELISQFPGLERMNDMLHLLEAARKENLKIVAIDLPAVESQLAGHRERSHKMLERIEENPFDNKALIVVGAYHAEHRQRGAVSIFSRLLASAEYQVSSVKLLSRAGLAALQNEFTARGLDEDEAGNQMRAWGYYFEDKGPADSFFISSISLGGLNYYSPLSGGWNTYQTGFSGLIYLSEKDASQIDFDWSK